MLIDRRQLILGAGAGLLLSACAPSRMEIDLDTELNALVNDPLQPLAGLSVLVQRQGRTVYEAQFGRRYIAPRGSNLGDQPVTRDTLFRMASVSKLVTGLGVMRLVDAGKLDLEADVSSVLGFRLRNPNFPDVPLTTRMFVSHLSSLTDAGGAYLTGDQTLQSAFTPGGAHYGSGSAWAKTAPGSYFQYCNMAYGVLAGIIERASGLRFDVFMQQQVLGPLGMQGGYDAFQLSPAQQAQHATLYRKQGKDDVWNSAGPWVAQIDDFRAAPPSPKPGLDGYVLGSNGSLFSPQGGLHTRVKDLGGIATMFNGGGLMADGQRFLSQASVDAMMTERWRADGRNGDDFGGEFQAWGMGMQHYIDRSRASWGDRLVQRGGLQAWGHLGFAYGLESGLMFEPKSGTSIVYVISGHAAEPTANRGHYSSYPVWEERLHDLLWSAAWKAST